MGELKDWVGKESKFIKIEDGETYTGVYKGFKFGEFRGQTVANYELDGKILSSGSKGLARQMDGVAPGTTVSISKFGEGPDTKYSVKIKNEVKTEW